MMLSRFRVQGWCRLLAGLMCLGSVVLRARSQNSATPHYKPSETPPAALTTVTVEPTVTSEMGDVGGRFFGREPDPKHTRHYYIAAEPVLWDFAPEGQDPVCGKPLPASLLLNRVSWKIKYVQYADAGFTARVLPEPRLGLLGPVLRGTTGEFIAVTFLNRAWLPLSMHPHGVRYDKDSEGSYYKPSPGRGAAIAPGAKFTYVWQLDEGAGPRPDEPSSKAWLYHSHVSGDTEANLGAIGFIVVTDPARARPDGTPCDVDREMAALFTMFDESAASGEAVEEPDEAPVNAPKGPVQRTWAEVQQLKEETQRPTINGLAYGNLAGLEMNEGERVRWYLFGLGSEEDFHTAHWHGLRVLEEGRRRTDVVELLPGSMKVADMVADDPGQWLFHCHVAEHMERGMFARMVVHPASDATASRVPEQAFFGMPQAVETLRLSTVELAWSSKASPEGELYLEGQVTVPDPFPLARNAVTVTIGEKSLTLRPDGSGLCVTPEAILLVKNVSPYGNGNVLGGRLNFELTLRGANWLEALRKQGVWSAPQALAKKAAVAVNLQVGEGRHRTTHTVAIEQ